MSHLLGMPGKAQHDLTRTYLCSIVPVPPSYSPWALVRPNSLQSSGLFSHGPPCLQTCKCALPMECFSWSPVLCWPGKQWLVFQQLDYTPCPYNVCAELLWPPRWASCLVVHFRASRHHPYLCYIPNTPSGNCWIARLSGWTSRSFRAGLCWMLLYPQALALCLASERHSINACWTNLSVNTHSVPSS